MAFAQVKSLADFFKDKKLSKVKQMYDAVKNLFKTGKDPILYTDMNQPVYKIEVIEGSFRKYPLGEIVYMPEERILEIYDSGSLIARWKTHKLIYQGFSEFLKSAGFEKNFVSLYNIV